MILLFLSAVAAAPSPTPAATRCPRTTSHVAVQPRERLAPRKLSDLPTANAYAAVYRHVDGCEVPVIVRYGVGKR